MNEEKTMILKMLEEGKISVEEAQALLDALEDKDEQDSGISAEDVHEEGDRHEKNHGHKNEDDSKERQGAKAEFDFDFSGLAQGLSSTFKGLGDSIGATVKEAVQGMKEFEKEFNDQFTGFEFKGENFEDVFGSAKSEREINTVCPADGSESIVINNKWGEVSVEGDDRADIGINAKVTAWGKDADSAQNAAEAVEVTCSLKDGKHVLRLKGSEKGSFKRVKVDYRILVPRSFHVTVKNLGGNIGASDLEGDVQLKGLAGDIKVSGNKGEQNLRTTAGNITLYGTGGETNLKSTAGNIKATLSGEFPVTASTTSGNITVGVLADSNYDFDLKAMAGNVKVEVPAEAEDSGRNYYTGTLNSGGPEVNCKSMAGNIKIEKV